MTIPYPVGEKPCPMRPDGRHRAQVWQGDGRSGFACRDCHRTWTWRDKELVATWPA